MWLVVYSSLSRDSTQTARHCPRWSCRFDRPTWCCEPGVESLGWIGIGIIVNRHVAVRDLRDKTLPSIFVPQNHNRPTKFTSRAIFLGPARRVRGFFLHGCLALACEVIGIGYALS
jgi:hypothetical protein